jgi:hypothetical protein
MQTAALVNALRTVEEKVDPGPRPAWYFHLYDYYSWTTKKEAYDTAQASLESCKSQIRDLAAKKVDLEEYIAHFHDNNKSPLKATWHFLLNSWNELARPVLHAFLFLSLLGLLIRIVFRYFLLKQQIGTVRL